ncbi:MAG: PAS domain S-box protein [Nitrospiraceae bacterium]|nr:PAS domain S-box protein [Nitrospiraceae bacterium]
MVNSIRQSIAYRLLFAIVFFSLLITFLLAGVQLYVDYRNGMSSIQEDFREIADVQLKSITESLWVMDRELLQAQLNGILNIGHMKYARIQYKNRLIASAGVPPAEADIHREFPLYRPYDNRQIYIGTLFVGAGMEKIYEGLSSKILSELFYQGIQVFLISLFMFFLFQLYVTRHLTAMAAYFRKQKLWEAEKPLTLEGYSDAEKNKDEIGQVVTAINTMGTDMRNAFSELERELQRRQQVEESLRVFRKLIDQSNDSIFVIDPESGLFLDVNDRACNDLGYDPQTLLAMKVAAISLAVPDKPMWQAHVAEVKNRGYMVLEDRLKRSDGTFFPVEVNVTYITLEKGNYLLAIVRDITERKRAEEALRESEEKYKNVFATATDSLFIIDAETKRIVDANAAACKLYGYRYEEMLTLRNVDLSAEPEKTLLAVNKKLDHVPVRFHRKKDGTVFPVEIAGSYYIERERTLHVAAIRDIAERKQAEDLLRESEEQLRVIFDTSQAGIILVAPEGKIIFANNRMAEMFGMPLGELVGTAYPDHLHTSEHAIGAELMRQLITGEIPSVSTERHYIRADGSDFWGFLSGKRLENPDGTVRALVGIIADITERRKLEEQLRHAQKMEAVGTLAGGIAHDFNNILNVIMGYGSLVLSKLEADSPSKNHMNEVLAAAERAANLTRRLLVFSRKQVADVKPTNVNETIIGIRKLLDRVISENIDFKLDLADRCLVVMADAGQIEQALINLVTNARDAMPKGGRLTIGTGPREIDDEYVAMYGYGKPGTYAIITVSDTGHGMDAETQKKIFEPFFTTKGIGEGTGLGLAISYGIIKQHRGYINVSSEPEKGTVFTIYLPLIEEQASLCRKKQVPVSAEGGNETVLVAEDDASLRRLTRIVLESFGYDVITAVNGEDAITTFMANRDKIALVVLDMIMPKKNGKEVGEAIREISSQTKILFVSGYTTDTFQNGELIESGFDFIHKPVQPEDLLRKVREILDR